MKKGIKILYQLEMQVRRRLQEMETSMDYSVIRNYKDEEDDTLGEKEARFSKNTRSTRVPRGEGDRHNWHSVTEKAKNQSRGRGAGEESRRVRTNQTMGQGSESSERGKRIHQEKQDEATSRGRAANHNQNRKHTGDRRGLTNKPKDSKRRGN